MKSIARLILPSSLLVTLALVTCFTSPAFAGYLGAERVMSVGLGGGVSMPIEDAKLAFQDGFNGQGYIRFNFDSPVSPRVDFTFQRFDFTDAEIVNPGNVTHAGNVIGVGASLELRQTSGAFQPYFVAGAAGYNVTSTLDGLSATQRTQFGVNGGVGAAWRLGGNLSLYAEGRLHHLFMNRQGGIVDLKEMRLVPVTFGLVY